MQDFLSIFNAIGAIGTMIGAVGTAVAVIVSFKPYRRKLSVDISIEKYIDSADECSINIYNTGYSIFIKLVNVYNRHGIVFTKVLDAPVLVARDSCCKISVDKSDINDLKYHIKQYPKGKFYVLLQNVHGKEYKVKIKLEWLKSISGIAEEAVVKA